MANSKIHIGHFFDPRTSTMTYVVHDPDARVGVVIDPVTDLDARSGRVSFESCDRVAWYVEEHGLEIPYVLDTHAHADHLSGIPFFKERYGARSGIGSRITEVQRIFRDVYNLGEDFPVDGSQFDRLLQEGDVLEMGSLQVEVLDTPGHTPACVTYRIGDLLVVGDTLFMPDHGTARCDFPGGSAAHLYDSIQRLYAFPDETRMFTCHDYQPGGRPLRFESTIGEQKATNVQLNADTALDDFVVFRRERDAQLDVPALMLASLQVNIRGGALPEPESNGTSYLKIPLSL
jgi:glyoxylase-like metal-dependent hydrolase (beta-lactamase superfamily II)